MTVRSRGGLLFDRYWQLVEDGLGYLPDVWKVPFNAADPVTTPNTLDTANPAVQTALGDAIAELRAAGIQPDAPLGEHQFVVRNDRKIGIHGGDRSQGVLNMIISRWDPQRGNAEVVHGSSHIQVVSVTGDRCPDAATLLTYSQSSDPASAHYSDQTALFSAGTWVRSRFCERDILSSPELRVVHVHER